MPVGVARREWLVMREKIVCTDEPMRDVQVVADMLSSPAEQVFFNVPLLLLDDAGHSQKEPRLHALGKTDEGRTLHITFTLRQSSQLIRVISARDRHRKERAIYEQAD